MTSRRVVVLIVAVASLAVVLAALGFSAILWAETRAFDAAVARLRRGMTEAQVVGIMGGRVSRLGKEGAVGADQHSRREWYASFMLPPMKSDYVLTVSANERKAYIYFDDSRRVSAVLVARKGRRRAFEPITLQPVGGP